MSSAAAGRRTRVTRGIRFGSALMVGVLLIIALASALVFVLAAGLLEAEAVITDTATRESVLGPITASTFSRLAFAIGSLAVGLGSLAALVSRASGSTEATAAAHVVTADDAGVVLITNSGIASLIEHAVLRTHGVIEVGVTVKGRGAAPIGIRVDCLTRAGTDLDRAGKAVRAAAREAAERLGGLDVSEVVVSLDVLTPEDMGLRTL